MLDISYVGSFGRHLGEVIQLNAVPFGARFLTQNQNPQTNTPLPDNYFRPYFGHGNIPQQIFEGNSSYHSVQVQLNRRFAKGLQFGVVYTRSKAMAYAEGDSTGRSSSGGTNQVARFLDRRFWNYGLASYDRPNILTFHFLWDVPKLSRWLPNPVVKALFDGWQISDITSFISGRPEEITMTTSPNVNDLFAGGGDGVRPIMSGNPILPKDKRTFDEYYNTAAFTMPTPVNRAACTNSGCPPITWANFGNMPRGHPSAVRESGIGIPRYSRTSRSMSASASSCAPKPTTCSTTPNTPAWIRPSSSMRRGYRHGPPPVRSRIPAIRASYNSGCE